MSDPRNPRPAASPAQKLAEAEAEFKAATRAAERAFSHGSMLARDRLEYAKRQRGLLAKRLADLEPLRRHPDGQWAYTQTALLLAVYDAVQKMMEVDLDCQGYNQELLETPSNLEGEDFREPGSYLGYMEARGRLDLALAYFYWTCLADGIDIVLRAAMNERAIEPRTPDEEASRAARAQELRAAGAADRDVAMLTGSLAAGFNEALELMQWGIEKLPELDTRNAQVKRELLRDARWAKLNGKVQKLLGDVNARVRGTPAIAKLFPPLEPVKLPYALATDAPAQGRHHAAAAAATASAAAARIGATAAAEKENKTSSMIDAMRAAVAAAADDTPAPPRPNATPGAPRPALSGRPTPPAAPRPGGLGPRPQAPARPQTGPLSTGSGSLAGPTAQPGTTPQPGAARPGPNLRPPPAPRPPLGPRPGPGSAKPSDDGDAKQPPRPGT